jgi:hypothetical protein
MHKEFTEPKFEYKYVLGGKQDRNVVINTKDKTGGKLYSTCRVEMTASLMAFAPNLYFKAFIELLFFLCNNIVLRN